VSYVGYSLKEPWGEPRVVIGIDADEAEFLADFLDRDECASIGQLPSQQVVPLQGIPHQGALHQGTPHQGTPHQGTPHQGTPHQGTLPQALLAEPSQPQEGEYASQVLLGAPVSLGIPRQAVDTGREMAAELAGWSSGELPGQASEQLAGWPPTGMTSPGLNPGTDQQPGTA
jgi:hypothetical protein